MTIQINPPPTIGKASVETQRLITFLQSAAIGQVFTYKEMNDAAKCDVQIRNTVLQTARRTLSKIPHQMVFGTIMGVGIKRLSDEEIPEVGVQAVKRCKRITRRAMDMMNCADSAKITDETKIRLYTTKTVLALFHTSGTSHTKGIVEQSVRISNGVLNVGDILALFNK